MRVRVGKYNGFWQVELSEGDGRAPQYFTPERNTWDDAFRLGLIVERCL